MTSVEAYSTVRTGTRRERVAAAMGLALALVVLSPRLRRTVRAARRLSRHLLRAGQSRAEHGAEGGLPFRAARLARKVGRRPLTAEQAEALVGAVRHTSRWWPGRAACMETSLGAVLAAALLGYRLNWCLGPRFSPPPTEYHAWVELPDHGPVGEYTAAGWHHHTALTI
ncbi:lasso peptide biosynthesis B2 protein [Streptomyces yunnanensis]|uniref:Transglutaminase-like superfamily protein n=1 Tax=Streptomyces yunnanensis TaxID=156453 RepID=A0A9X8N8Z9_9ACTN|nr:lasso peptide biosynthesis B2 protein [Streptomyces yunnanensis]SHN31015.1 Transglutaminase-like superfamily protein [Streptomyces yunnanensis]